MNSLLAVGNNKKKINKNAEVVKMLQSAEFVVYPCFFGLVGGFVGVFIF